jgi:hypothetical protein
MAVTSTGGAAAPGSDQAANSIFAGPATGTPAATQFRAMVNADLPFAVPITNANLVNQGNNDLLALQELGANFKGYTLGNAFPTNGNAVSIVNGIGNYFAAYVPKAATLTGIDFFVTTRGTYTSTGYNGFALYTINTGTGLLTQVAATTSSTTIWSTANGLNSVNFATPYAATEGVYFVAYIGQWSAASTVPGLWCSNITYANSTAFNFPNSIKVSAYLSPQTTLPATQAFSALSANNLLPYIYLY